LIVPSTTTGVSANHLHGVSSIRAPSRGRSRGGGWIQFLLKALDTGGEMTRGRGTTGDGALRVFRRQIHSASGSSAPGSRRRSRASAPKHLVREDFPHPTCITRRLEFAAEASRVSPPTRGLRRSGSQRAISRIPAHSAAKVAICSALQRIVTFARARDGGRRGGCGRCGRAGRDGRGRGRAGRSRSSGRGGESIVTTSS